jgi:hypothetical protein
MDSNCSSHLEHSPGETTSPPRFVYLDRMFSILGVLAFLLTLGSTLCGVVARYFGVGGFEWSFELAGIAFLWMTFTGTVLAARPWGTGRRCRHRPARCSSVARRKRHYFRRAQRPRCLSHPWPSALGNDRIVAPCGADAGSHCFVPACLSFHTQTHRTPPF